MISKNKPFLKWAGNKYRIVPEIRRILNRYPEAKRLVEPFVGSGAVFLNSDYPAYRLCDANPDLIRLYQTLQTQGQTFIEYAQTFFNTENNTPDAYYRLRSQFNRTTDPALKSALFLYLNRHGYNGLCRYNAQGLFNVPFGRYTKPYFPHREMQQFYQKAQCAVFEHADFIEVMQSTESGDILYCDPPYVPLSATAHFTAYSKAGFNSANQTMLARVAETLMSAGIPVVISNHDTPFVRELYQKATLTELSVQRSISCNGANRKPSHEVLALFHPAHEDKAYETLLNPIALAN